MKLFIIIMLTILILFLLATATTTKHADAFGVELGCYVNETFENGGELQVIREGNLVTTTLKP